MVACETHSRDHVGGPDATGDQARAPVDGTIPYRTGDVRTYGQYCPIARGAEIFAERWTPLIVRSLYLGCGNLGEILEGAPGLSRTLLSQRLKQLERVGIVELVPKPDGRGHHYNLTSAGHELFTVCQSLGEWGARWLELRPENFDPFVALWSMGNALRRDAEAFVKWHAGQLTWAQARREERIQLDGPPSLVRAFPTWNARSMFAHVTPVSRKPHVPA